MAHDGLQYMQPEPFRKVTVIFEDEDGSKVTIQANVANRIEMNTVWEDPEFDPFHFLTARNLQPDIDYVNIQFKPFRDDDGVFYTIYQESENTGTNSQVK